MYSVKRDLLQCQKRPTTVSKETYLKKSFLYIYMYVSSSEMIDARLPANARTSTSTSVL